MKIEKFNCVFFNYGLKLLIPDDDDDYIGESIIKNENQKSGIINNILSAKLTNEQSKPYLLTKAIEF